MNNTISIFEYDFLSTRIENERCRKISRAAFDYLETLCLEGTDQFGSLLRLNRYHGHRALQVRNYAGVIATPDGLHIEILPKTGRSNNADDQQSARASLLNMLRSIGHFRHIQLQNAQIACQNMPLLEIFIGQFLESVNHLIKRGLRSDYVRTEDNLYFMKGKLQVAQQLKHNLINQHRFYVAYDEYQLDRPANRLIHSALNKVLKLSRSQHNQKLCRELLQPFSDVPLSQNIQQDFSRIQRNRGMDHYQSPLSWSKLILEGMSPLSSAGKTHAFSLLFPMEAVFETYVARVLRTQLQPPLKLKEQASSKALVNFNGAPWFRLKPDLLIERNKKPFVVLDTKWKVIASSKGNSAEKFGLSQGDFYQMFAYGQKYLGGSGDMILIYPQSAEFQVPIESAFEFSEDLRLWVVPFIIDAIVQDVERLMLPEEIASLIG
ncbi:McrC family protein [Endozoicomonas ascidiicola]|uniref:McrC family protein n=1 Tax=Endozoicomonas ascidiicola TaxID=1698521 RepID=UPI000832AF2E|nr:McrC family protein [Endozoicomonas ascidiicola]